MAMFLKISSVVVLFMSGTFALARGADSPRGIIAAFDQSIASQGPGAFMKVCDNEIATMAPGATCGALLERGWKEKIKLKAGPERIQGANATLDVSVEREGKSIETLYFMLIKFKGKWLLKKFGTDAAQKVAHLGGTAK